MLKSLVITLWLLLTISPAVCAELHEGVVQPDYSLYFHELTFDSEALNTGYRQVKEAFHGRGDPETARAFSLQMLQQFADINSPEILGSLNLNHASLLYVQGRKQASKTYLQAAEDMLQSNPDHRDLK